MPVLECLADVMALRQAQGSLFRQERGRIGHRLSLLLARCRLSWLLAVDFRLERGNCAGLELRFDCLCAVEGCRVGSLGLGYSMQPVEGVLGGGVLAVASAVPPWGRRAISTNSWLRTRAEDYMSMRCRRRGHESCLEKQEGVGAQDKN